MGGFNNRNMLVKLNQDKPTAEMVWQDKRRAALSPVNVQPFLVENTMYGFDQNGTLYAVDVPTGERLWETNEPLDSDRPLRSGTAFIVKNGDRFFMFNELGELLITQLSRDGYKELSSMKVIKPTNMANGRDVVWSPPAWANKKVFIRNDEEIISIDLAK